MGRPENIVYNARAFTAASGMAFWPRRIFRLRRWTGIPAAAPALILEKGGLLVTVEEWGEANRLTFDTFGQPMKWIALVNTGTGTPTAS